MSHDFAVPVVDISPYVDMGSPEQRAAAAAAFDEAARTVGFVQSSATGSRSPSPTPSPTR